MSEKKINSNENSTNSLIPIFLYIILKEKSSAEHPLSRQEIDTALKDEYGVTVSSGDRKKTVRCINTLSSSKQFAGMIAKTKKKSDSHGMVDAWYMKSERPSVLGGCFSFSETAFLIDMIKDCKIISSECTNALIHKLVASLTKSEQQRLLTTQHEDGIQKNENQNLLEIKAALDRAIDDFQRIDVYYEEYGNEETVYGLPRAVKRRDGKYCVLIETDEAPLSIPLEDIKWVDGMEEGSRTVRKAFCDTSLDTLFFNVGEIARAVKGLHYLSFSYLSYDVPNKPTADVVLMESHYPAVIPINTAYKDDKLYLIAVNPNDDYKPSFFRVDLMKDVKGFGSVDWSDRNKIGPRESSHYTDAHPFMISGFKETRAHFWIKSNALDRVIDAFGNKAKFLEKKEAYESVSTESVKGKLIHAYPDDFGALSGFDPHEELVRFTVLTTEEDAFRFALLNADAVEVESPIHLRARILAILKEGQNRYSKTQQDREEERYRKVMVGKDFLTYGTETQKRIEKENACGAVKKLELRKLEAPLSFDLLEKYTGVEELIIKESAVAELASIAKLPSLRCLMLIDTSIESGDDLAKIPQLDRLLLQKNRALKDYKFLRNMNVNVLYIGRNGKAAPSDLYDLQATDLLALEESVFYSLDMERLMTWHNETDKNRRHMSIRRWINSFIHEEFPPLYPLR